MVVLTTARQLDISETMHTFALIWMIIDLRSDKFRTFR
jgi:hypothetical protein